MSSDISMGNCFGKCKYYDKSENDIIFIIVIILIIVIIIIIIIHLIQLYSKTNVYRSLSINRALRFTLKKIKIHGFIFSLVCNRLHETIEEKSVVSL